MRNLLPKDPEILDQVITNFAYHLPHRLISEALKISESTVRSWKDRKEIRQLIARKKLDILSKPLQATADRFPLQFIERHPDTREIYAPPTNKTQVEATGAFPTLMLALLGEIASRYDIAQVVDVEYQEQKQIEGGNGTQTGTQTGTQDD